MDVWAKMIIRYKPNAFDSCGMMTLHMEPTKPMFEYMRYRGTVMMLLGIDMNAKVTVSRSFRPGNLMVATAYPANVAKIVEPSPAATAYRIVFHSHLT